VQKCCYCGRENDEEVSACPGCGTPLRDAPPVPPDPERELRKSPEVSRVMRCVLLLLVWLAPIIALIVLYPPTSVRDFFLSAVLFPLGWMQNVSLPLPDDWSRPTSDLGGVSAIGWLIYAALTAGALLARRRRLYLVLLGTLCLLLLLNFVGCRQMFNTKWTQ